MKKTRISVLMLLIAAIMSVPAFADIISTPDPVRNPGSPVLVIAVVLVAAAIIIFVLRRNKKK
ncbi:MAG: hypothetical protein J5449_10320 [Oscillospiraceae bacterium]|nr:hypothetical protein [Oscillospiraceae bacterium]